MARWLVRTAFNAIWMPCSYHFYTLVSLAMATRHLPVVGGHPVGAVSTLREDNWWLGPLVTLGVFSGFVVYVTWAALQGEHYYADPYLSPFYSPVVYTDLTAQGAAPVDHAWFGAWPAWWPGFLPASPALFILMFPGLFRFTCYYYRKAYYRSFVGSPPGCSVAPITRRGYKGETGLMLFQNLHRYALYFALIYIPILYYDAFLALSKDGQLGIGVGTVILFVNASLIAFYTFGCHSLRHIVGGHDDCMSCGKNTVKFSLWKRVTWFNERHMLFAWVSLLFVVFTDIYIRLVSAGAITDYNTWN